jgi:membrane protease YdiL (CAAX protease family)
MMAISITRVLNFPVTKIITGVAVCFSLLVGIQNFVSKPFFYSIIQDKSIADPVIHCVSFIVLLAGYYCLFRLYDKREVTELSIKHLFKEMFGGFALGFLTISLSIFILYLSGHYQVLGITTSHYSIKLFTVLLVAALIEDLFIRGLIVRELENWLGTNVTILIGMLLETWHVFNDNSTLFSLVTDLVWGFTLAMLFIYTKRIWLPFFFHLGWNFSQPFYGSNLTGLDNMGSIIQSEFSGSELLTGGAIGIEGSVITVFLLLFIGITLYYLAKKEGKIIKRKQVKG